MPPCPNLVPHWYRWASVMILQKVHQPWLFWWNGCIQSTCSCLYPSKPPRHVCYLDQTPLGYWSAEMHRTGRPGFDSHLTPKLRENRRAPDNKWFGFCASKACTSGKRSWLKACSHLPWRYQFCKGSIWGRRNSTRDQFHSRSSRKSRMSRSNKFWAPGLRQPTEGILGCLQTELWLDPHRQPRWHGRAMFWRLCYRNALAARLGEPRPAKGQAWSDKPQKGLFSRDTRSRTFLSTWLLSRSRRCT